MNNILRSSSPRQSGFSLIEVLIGAVILATGLLALSALQGSLARNAADSRIRSQIAAAMESAAEVDRSGISFSAVPAAPASVNVPGVGALDIVIASCSYVNLEDPGENTSTCVGAGGTAAEPQYKRINYSASWQDVSGNSRSMTLTSIVSPRTMSTFGTLPFSTPTEGPEAISPIVRTANPEKDGMIPIAIGDGTDTAATNPKPTVIDGQVVRTDFQVLTYSADGDLGYRQQRRVETAVVGCKCGSSRPAEADIDAMYQRAQWPAYWNGNQYVIYAPADQAAAPGASKTAWPKLDGDGDPVTNQDALCTECCRDHHDGNAGVKFDPYRADAHEHYNLDGSGVLVKSENDYLEVCRMIRVDGFWRTAQDMDAKHAGLLKTASLAKSALPDATAKIDYENFVIDYLNARYVSGQTSTVAEEVYQSRNLSDAGEVTITKSTSPKDTRYLHARGLYVDNVEPDVATKIQKAFASCPTGKTKSDCVFPLLAFTSINLTEHAFWDSMLAGTPETINLSVTTSGIQTADPTSPHRGAVSAKTGAVPDQRPAVRERLFKSNSGLVTWLSENNLTRGIDPDDDVSVSDTQPFVISGDATIPGRKFKVIQSGRAFTGTFPRPKWREAGTTGAWEDCGEGSSPSFTCDVGDYTGDVEVSVSYNFMGKDSVNKNTNLPCSDGRTYKVPAKQDYNKCMLYETSTITVNAAASSLGMSASIISNPNDQNLSETTLLSISGVPSTVTGEVTVTLIDDSSHIAPLSCSPASGTVTYATEGVTCP